MTQPVRLQIAAAVTAAWIGAALITVGVVAPGAFAVLPSRSLAGELVGWVLPPLFVAGIVVAVAVVFLAGPPRLAGMAGRASIAAGLVASACAIAQFVITPKLDGIRASIGGPIDALAPGDPRRVAFGLLHGYNVAGLALAMVGALVCLTCLSFAIHPRR